MLAVPESHAQLPLARRTAWSEAPDAPSPGGAASGGGSAAAKIPPPSSPHSRLRAKLRSLRRCGDSGPLRRIGDAGDSPCRSLPRGNDWSFSPCKPPRARDLGPTPCRQHPAAGRPSCGPPSAASPPAAPPAPPVVPQTPPQSPRKQLLAARPEWQPRREPLAAEPRPLRLLLVRHAQSANKRRASGEEASKDPGLSDLGHQQAKDLADRLRDFLSGHRVDVRSGLLVVSSPMLRCLLTIQPTVEQLGLSPGCCLCHGGCFEYGCAGTAFAGSLQEEIAANFPDFLPVGFRDDGHWDYHGSNKKEEDSEFVARGERIAKWLRGDAAAQLRAPTGHGSMPTLILVTHQTLGDLLCHLLIEGTAERWEYGSLRHRLQNAVGTEIFLHPGGGAAFGLRHV